MHEQTDEPTTVWKRLDEVLVAFRAAWVGATEPPPLASFLPESPAELRRLAAVELVKLDLVQRWPKSETRKRLETYLTELPEIAESGVVPPDLVFEEYQVRRRNGEAVSPDEYAKRFPKQAAALESVLAVDDPHATTSLAELSKATGFQAGQKLDDFDLLVPLGSGSFASVFLARQRSLGRMVALKISTDRGIESQTLAQLDHPFIVRVYDERRLPEQHLHLMYMQYVAGGTLRDVAERVAHTPPALRSGKLMLQSIDEALQNAGQSPPGDSRARQSLAQLSWPEAVCWLGARIAAALEHAHSHGVLHRDLKPANVLLAADGSPKLADFNVSSCTEVAGATAQAYFGGSLAYMSPEQMEGCMAMHEGRPPVLDERTDLYSLGIVLWELLEGRRPFYDDVFFNLSPMGMRTMLARRQQGIDEKMLSRLPRDCPAGLVEVLAGCLQPSVPLRLASASIVRRQLDLCLRPEVQVLLRPRHKSWLPALRAHPLPLIIACGIAPNVVGSVMNIAYNQHEIIGQLADERVPQIFQAQLMTINPAAYAIGIAILLSLAWPVLRAAQQRAAGAPADARLERWRHRSLWLGDFVAWISGVEWIVSGVIFPTWLQLALGTATGLSPQQWIHFVASQSVCGLLSSTMAFFLVTLYSAEVLTPVLLQGDQDDEPMRGALERLSARTGMYTFLSLAALPVALVVMPLVRTESRMAFLVLGLVGLVATRLAFVLARRIQRATDALQVAVSVEDLVSGTETTDSLRLRRSR